MRARRVWTARNEASIKYRHSSKGRSLTQITNKYAISYNSLHRATRDAPTQLNFTFEPEVTFEEETALQQFRDAQKVR